MEAERKLTRDLILTIPQFCVIQSFNYTFLIKRSRNVYC